MNILSTQRLYERNVWSATPMFLAQVDCSDWRHVTAADVESIVQRAARELPNLAGRWEAVATDSHPGDFLLAKLAAEIAVVLQIMAGAPVKYGHTQLDGAPGVFDVALEMNEAALAHACLEAACRICVAALDGRELEVRTERARLRLLAEDVCLGSITGPLVAAARARGIPVRRLDDESLVQLGWGAQQHRIQKAFTSRTGKIAEWISVDKDLTKRLLDESGVPVPWGKTAGSAEEAWRAACEVGFPVAIKPRNCDRGNGISLNLTTREQVLAAFDKARELREQVVVERFVWGEQYRILVVGQRMVAANRREVPSVVGDGERTIRELIELANLDPRRGEEVDNDHPCCYICPDEDTPQVLAEQGLELTSIPPTGQEVMLSRLGHLWAGGRLADCTDLVHPLTAEQCVTAVRVLGLDLAGLDVIARDISVPLNDQGGAILEVNAEPAIVLHFPPYCEVYQPVCEAIVESLIPHGTTGRIPLALVTEGPDSAQAAHDLAHLLSGTGQRVACATSQGLFLGELRLKAGNQATLAGGRALLLSPQVECAVMERTLTSVLQEGLGIDQCDVVLVSGVNCEESRAKRAVEIMVEAVRPGGTVVLEAIDPEHDPLVIAGRSAGQRVVCLCNGRAVLMAADGNEQVLPLPCDEGSLLGAIAAAWAMDVPLEVIRKQLANFS